MIVIGVEKIKFLAKLIDFEPQKIFFDDNW